MRGVSVRKFGFLALLSFLFILLLAGCASTGASSYTFTENEDKGSVVLYFFWGDGCPHCAAAKPVLAEMKAKYPELAIHAYEVYYNETNQAYYLAMADKFQLPETGRGVPLLFLNDQYWIGWSDSIRDEIENQIASCSKTGCADAGAGIMPGAEVGDENPAGPSSANPVDPTSREIELFGQSISLEHQSLFVSTLLISFVDGVNPCSVWVLTMLLALTIHSGSRKKVLAIGVIFLTVTAAVYAMFIAGLFTFLSIVSFATWIRVVVALVSVFFAIVNIKDYFWYKEGISFTISDESKPGIFKRMRKVMDASESFWPMAGATVVLAAGVSLVEFSCTAGFPVLWTNLLTSQNVTLTHSLGIFLLLLLVYMLIYQLDEMVIFGTAVATLKASRMEEKQGRILKLIGGMLMLTLGVVMIANPAFMNTLTGSLIVFAIAAVLVLIVLLLHRRILPSFGIWIGTEGEGRRKAMKKRQVKKTTHRH